MFDKYVWLQAFRKRHLEFYLNASIYKHSPSNQISERLQYKVDVFKVIKVFKFGSEKHRRPKFKKVFEKNRKKR